MNWYLGLKVQYTLHTQTGLAPSALSLSSNFLLIECLDRGICMQSDILFPGKLAYNGESSNIFHFTRLICLEQRRPVCRLCNLSSYKLSHHMILHSLDNALAFCTQGLRELAWKLKSAIPAAWEVYTSSLSTSQMRQRLQRHWLFSFANPFFDSWRPWSTVKTMANGYQAISVCIKIIRSQSETHVWKKITWMMTLGCALLWN